MWAVAAIVLEVDDPMTVLNIMGFDSFRWLFSLTSFLHMVLRVDNVLELCCIEFLWLPMMRWDDGHEMGLFLQIFF